jgi:hypothetical protein
MDLSEENGAVVEACSNRIAFGLDYTFRQVTELTMKKALVLVLFVLSLCSCIKIDFFLFANV